MFARRTGGLVRGGAVFAAVLGMSQLLTPSRAFADQKHVRVVRPTCGPVWVPPVYATEQRVVTIPGVFEDREKRVWHEPVYETRQVVVEEPAEVVQERVPRYDRHGRFQGYRTVERVIRPARRTVREEQVLVRAGHYETIVERVCVQPERQEVVYDRVVVQPGRWEYPRTRTVVVDRAPVVAGQAKFYSKGFGLRGHYRDSDHWGLSIDVGR